MNRTITFLLLAALLMAGLGWFFDGHGADSSEESVQEVAASETAIGGPLFWPKEPDSPVEPATDGMVDLYLQVSSSDGVEVLPAGNRSTRCPLDGRRRFPGHRQCRIHRH